MVDSINKRDAISKLFRKRLLFILILSISLFILVGVVITIGPSNVGFFEAYQILIDQLFPGTFQYTLMHENIVMGVRASRILVGLCVGPILAIGGCIIQSVLRNPLATPYTLGISSSAGFGAAVAIAFGLSIASSTIGVIIFAFSFSLVPVVIIVLAAQRAGATPVTTVLCGVAIAQVFSAGNTIIQYFSSADYAKEIVFWSVGSLNNCSLWMVPYVAIAAILFIILAVYLSRDLNIMKMGDDTARSLGIDAERVRIVAIVASCLCTAVAVSFTGAIGFICLISPHICRIVIGGDLKYLIPASALMGALLLIIADTIGRTIISPVILPVGAVTALIGGPLLIYMLLRKKSSLYE
jgi:iron complex transport system permease protein